MKNNGSTYNAMKTAKVNTLGWYARGQLSLHSVLPSAFSTRRIAMYGPTKLILAIHRKNTIATARFAFSFGFNGGITERCLSQLMKSRVYTDTAIRMVCSGYTVLQSTLPKGHCFIRISTKSKGILITQVAKSVAAKLRMKTSVIRKRRLLKTAKQIKVFPINPAAVMIGKHIIWMIASRSNPSAEILLFVVDCAVKFKVKPFEVLKDAFSAKIFETFTLRARRFEEFIVYLLWSVSRMFSFFLCRVNKRPCARARVCLNGSSSYLNRHYLDVKINALDHLSPDWMAYNPHLITLAEWTTGRIRKTTANVFWKQHLSYAWTQHISTNRSTSIALFW